MIDDPIVIPIYRDHKKFHNSKNKKYPLFFVTPMTVTEHSILCLIINNKIVFDIIQQAEDGRNYHSTYDGYITLEGFVSEMMAEYPDYFEWLLFHPEWL